jgi:hypothetical protein
VLKPWSQLCGTILGDDGNFGRNDFAGGSGSLGGRGALEVYTWFLVSILSASCLPLGDQPHPQYPAP